MVVFVGLGALAGGCLLLFSNEVVNEIADEIDRELGVADKSDYDLTEGECTTDFVDDAKATGTITNTSSERQGFQITVRFIEADGTLISEDSTFTDGMDPNQSTDWDVISFEDATPGMTCTVEEVRYTIFD